MRLLILLIVVCALARPMGVVKASETPESETVLEISRINREMKLVVPSSFEGRKGKETSTGWDVSMFHRVRFVKEDSKTRLKGHVSRFDFDSEVSRLEGMLWRSSKTVPGWNACMDCHRPTLGDARTEVWVGEENRVLTPYPITQGAGTLLFPDADVQKGFMEVRHWFHPRGRVEGGGSLGRMRSFITHQKARSAWIGATYSDRHRFEVSTQLRFSKPALFKLKREFTGRVDWRQSRNLRVGIQGGILLDGFAHYDLGFSDLGAVTVSTERGAPQNLPSIYQRLKDDKFGYYSIEVRYDYAF